MLNNPALALALLALASPLLFSASQPVLAAPATRGCVSLTSTAPSSESSAYNSPSSNAGASATSTIASSTVRTAGYTAVASSSSAASATTSAAATSTTSTAASSSTLYPVVPPYTNSSSLQNLQPSSNCSFYYTNGTTDLDLDHIFATVNVTLQYDAVVLPHSEYVSDLVCDSAGLDVYFSDEEAYEYVKTNWPSSEFLLITDSLNCSQYEDGVHTYWLVAGLGFNDATRSVQVDGEEIAVENALDEVEVAWGTYTASGQTPAGCPYSLSPGDGYGNSTSTNGTTTGNSTTGGSSNSTTSSNSTSSYNSTFAACSNPPDSYMGLPTAPCGLDFDDVLDSKIGFYDFNNSSSLEEFDSDYDSSEADSGVSSSLRRRSRAGLASGNHLSRRWCFSCSIKKAIKSVASAVKTAVSKVVTVAKAGFTAVKQAASSIISAITSPSFDKSITVSSSPGELVESPWGEQYRIFSASKESKSGDATAELNLYCVDCGFKGTAHLHGAAKFSLLKGITSASVGVSGTLSAGIWLGLDATASYSHELEKTIATAAIPGAGIVIPKVVTIGVIAEIGVETSIEISAEGQILVGAGVVIQNYQATLDFVNKGGSTVTGFTPVITKNFTASAEVSATLEVGLPFELAVGLEFPLLSKKLTVGLKNTPAVEGTATVDVSVGSDSDCPNGLSLELGLTDTFAVDFFGKAYTLTKIEKKDLLSECYPTNLLTNPDFSTYAVNCGDCSDISISPWFLTKWVDGYYAYEVNVDNYNPTYNGAAACLDLNAEYPYTVGQWVNTTVGASYELVYYVSSNSHCDYMGSVYYVKTGYVQVNGTSPQNFTYDETVDSDYLKFTLNFTATVAQTLVEIGSSFQSLYCGPLAGYVGLYEVHFSEYVNGCTTCTNISISPWFMTEWDASDPYYQLDASGHLPTYNGAAASLDLNDIYPYTIGQWANTTVGQEYQVLYYVGSYDCGTERDVRTGFVRVNGSRQDFTYDQTIDTGLLRFTLNFTAIVETTLVEIGSTFELIYCGAVAAYVGLFEIESAPTTTTIPSTITTLIARRSGLFARDSNSTASTDTTSTASSTTVSATAVATTSDNITISYFDPDTEDGETVDDYETLNATLSSLEDEYDADGTGDSNSTYVSLLDVTGTYALAEDKWGSFILVDAADAANYLYYSDEEIIDTDAENNIFYFYPEEMSVLGVSRFRVKNETYIPLGAEIIMLVPIAPVYNVLIVASSDADYDDDSTTSAVYATMDTSENLYYTVACNIDSVGNKVFLVANVTEGIAQLQKAEMAYVITGGTVTDCGAVAFASTFSGY
ncbi:hypothetical protein HK405_003028 [Cladochytrium tenue]|nr:hypothetical protein HK405_003028 [Cladochytrium tenue]